MGTVKQVLLNLDSETYQRILDIHAKQPAFVKLNMTSFLKIALVEYLNKVENELHYPQGENT